MPHLLPAPLHLLLQGLQPIQTSPPLQLLASAMAFAMISYLLAGSLRTNPTAAYTKTPSRQQQPDTRFAASTEGIQKRSSSWAMGCRPLSNPPGDMPGFWCIPQAVLCAAPGPRGGSERILQLFC